MCKRHSMLLYSTDQDSHPRRRWPPSNVRWPVWCEPAAVKGLHVGGNEEEEGGKWNGFACKNRCLLNFTLYQSIVLVVSFPFGPQTKYQNKLLLRWNETTYGKLSCVGSWVGWGCLQNISYWSLAQLWLIILLCKYEWMMRRKTIVSHGSEIQIKIEIK